MTEDESLAYFRTRGRESRLGAWASPQSRPIADRTELDERYAAAGERFADVEDVPLPPFWGGFRLVPRAFELWENRPNRLHDRARDERVERRLVARCDWRRRSGYEGGARAALVYRPDAFQSRKPLAPCRRAARTCCSTCSRS